MRMGDVEILCFSDKNVTYGTSVSFYFTKKNNQSNEKKNIVKVPVTIGLLVNIKKLFIYFARNS